MIFRFVEFEVVYVILPVLDDDLWYPARVIRIASHCHDLVGSISCSVCIVIVCRSQKRSLSVQCKPNTSLNRLLLEERRRVVVVLFVHPVVRFLVLVLLLVLLHQLFLEHFLTLLHNVLLTSYARFALHLAMR